MRTLRLASHWSLGGEWTSATVKRVSLGHALYFWRGLAAQELAYRLLADLRRRLQDSIAMQRMGLRVEGSELVGCAVGKRDADRLNEVNRAIITKGRQLGKTGMVIWQFTGKWPLGGPGEQSGGAEQ